MLERQLRLLGSVSRTLAALGPPENFPDVTVPIYPDEIPGHGPLGGIYTGLYRARTEFNLFLGCDLPFMQAAFLDYLCREALRSRADVTVPETRDGLQPLCAVYRRRAIRAVRASLLAGENKVAKFFPEVRCRKLGWIEISSAGFDSRIFANMNTPEEYRAALKSCGTSG